MERRKFILLTILLTFLAAGRARATVVYIQSIVEVKTLNNIYGQTLPDSLVAELLNELRDSADLRPWDYEPWTSHTPNTAYRIVLRLEEVVPGKPPAIDLAVELWADQHKSTTVKQFSWREVNSSASFGTAEAVTGEILVLLRRELFSPQSAGLQHALQKTVPVGFGAKVRSATSVLLALSERRYLDLQRSDFHLLCPHQKNAVLYCAGSKFVPWSSSSLLEATPLCLEDDDTHIHPVASNSSTELTKLEPQDIYLDNVIKKGEFSYFRRGCP